MAGDRKGKRGEERKGEVVTTARSTIACCASLYCKYNTIGICGMLHVVRRTALHYNATALYAVTDSE